MTTDSAYPRSRPAPRRRALRLHSPPPPDRPWEHLTAQQRLARLLAANAPLGHDLSSLSIAEALYTLNVRFGVIPAPNPNDPPASYMQEVARALRAAAHEHGDMRGARAIERTKQDEGLHAVDAGNIAHICVPCRGNHATFENSRSCSCA